MNKNLEKFLLLILGVGLVVGMILTSQVRWTTDQKEGIPLEEVFGGNNRKDSNQQTEVEVEVNEAGFPKRIIDLQLDEFLVGQEAIIEINKDLEIDLELLDGYAGYYSNAGRGEVKVFISELDSFREIEEINNEIKANEQFAETNFFMISGEKIYFTQKEGLNYYYYQQGNKVYWIAVSGVDEMLVVGHLINIL
ncbi:hypothetical protein [Natroniella sp. ANB-PHB2]|uniref:hypothetical protein n=1 Tax=Natroniella sp. ANB-PHB2 TaxID=3384444 RepID=UPI0038D4533B